MNNSTDHFSSDGEHIDAKDEARTDKSVPDDVFETPLTPTPSRLMMRQRLMSDESHESDSSKATSLGYCDSGHYSSANVSDSQPVKTSIQSHDILRQKDQALFLALQDVRRLRSELERLSKSEKWYKQELRQQKHARLEALEKLYGNERNYMQENQRLQRECLRLYAKCGDIERELEQQRVKQTLEARQKEHEAHFRQGRAGSEQRDFESEQQQALIVDQQQLIEVLRKQKRALLADFKRLNEEKDAQIYDLQRNIALLEAENLQVTKKCKTLLDERRYLEETIAEHGNELLEQQEKQRKLELAAQATESTIIEQQRELVEKEKEIHELQRNFKYALQNEIEADAIHRLSVDFQKDLREKTQEIMALKNAQQTLQQELEVLNELQAQNEEQQRELEHLEAALADKNCELSQLQECDARKCAEIAALKAEVAEYQNMTRNLEQREQQRQESYIAEMLRSQEAVKSVELELISANQRYANMCVLCERTRFELDMREIELSKIKFEKSRDVTDVQQLREKLGEYLKQTNELSVKIQELEKELSEQKELAKDVLKVDQGTQWTVLDKIKDELMEELSGVMMEENLIRIKQENFLFDKEFEDMLKKDAREEVEEREKEILERVFEKNINFEDDEKDSKECVGTAMQNEDLKLEKDFEKDSYLYEQKINREERDNDEVKERGDFIRRSNAEEQKCREQNGKWLTRENEQVSQIDGEWKNIPEDPDLRDIDVKMSDIMAYLKKLENENTSLKKFIQVREEAGMENDITLEETVPTLHIQENKEHHLATGKEESKSLIVKVDLESKERSNHYIKLREDDIDELQSKLDVMNEYLKEIHNETNEQKELINNLNKKVREEEKRSEIELKKSQETHHNENNLREQKLLNESKFETGHQEQCRLPKIDDSDVEFKNLAQRLLETHQLIEELQVKNSELKNLIEEHTTATELQQENEKVIEELKNDLNLFKAENNHKNSQIQELHMKLSESQASLQNLVKEQQEMQLKLTEMKSLNDCNVKDFHQTTAELQKSTAVIKTLHLKLLENDAKLYKIQRRKQQLEFDLEETSEKLEATNKKLQQESRQQSEKEQNMEQNHQHPPTSDIPPAKLESAPVFSSMENDKAELQRLRERVADLEAELKQAYNVDNQQRSERIELLNKLLEQQNQKVIQLNAAQADWEELLNQLNAAHAQEAATSAELQQKRADLEELNELFHKQNFELQTLYQINQNQDSSKDRELQALKKTCAQQEAAMKTQADLIESLHLKNQHLEKTVNEDYAAEVGENKKELRMLRQQVSKFSEERQDVATRMQEMEKELSDLRQAKRKAIIVPQLVFADSDTSDSLASNAESSEASNSAHRDNVDDHLRILSKVLEHEYKKKTERSELHISALLSNIKRLKRSLSVKDQDIAKLLAHQTVSKEQQQELQCTKRQLLEMRHRYEQSQTAAKSLEQQLTTLRKQFENTDCGKVNVNEAAHEVANLIDDHKKLIQQSAANTKRPKTSTILDLIQRSNRSVPKLNKLETSIEELRHDIQQYIGASQNALSMGNFSTQAYRQPSLLDELHQAAIANA